ncbi:UbiA prenyltransferase family [Mycena metata]|uniref:UbiA prenyltransferase family n=1 Tax=Mycena metata TaxID=1033252 RepID=A0AAD7K4J8_9AGAR|nr:UbiA prenyltransferase family [Mycena metata]
MNVCKGTFRRAQNALYFHLQTLCLFTKYDTKTILLPITLLAIASAPLSSAYHLPHVIFWIWFHLLQFNVSNQLLQPEEDALNKPDRPLPSNRLSLPQAILLRWCLVPLCLGLSDCYSVEALYVSIAVVALTFLYNEGSAHRQHWLIRNAVNAAGLACFEDWIPTVLTQLRRCQYSSQLAFFTTTVHAQDFRDELGDRAVGRRTIPITLPSVARYTVVVPLTLWSAGLTMAWKLDFAASISLISFSLFVGMRYILFNTVESDKVSYSWHNVRVVL